MFFIVFCSGHHPQLACSFSFSFFFFVILLFSFYLFVFEIILYWTVVES